jgi:polygalacturonase
VRISDCFVSVGDDCITLKSGAEHERTELRAPCRDITITNCTLERGHGGIVIGSEMSGGVQNVVVSNCVFIDTDRGIRLKSRRGRGGTVENVRISNLIMDGVLCPFTMNLYYGCGAWGDEFVSDKSAKTLDAGTPRFRHIHISHVIARKQNLSDVCIHHCRAMGAGPFLHFEGSKHNFQHHLTLTGNVVTPEQIKFVDTTDTAGHP